MQEIKKVTVKVPQAYLDFMNQIFEIEKKSSNLKEENSIQRNLNKMKGILEEEFFKGSTTIGLTYHNPLEKAIQIQELTVRQQFRELELKI